MRITTIATLVISLLALILGCLSLSLNTLEPYSIILLSLLSISYFALFLSVRIFKKQIRWAFLALGMLSLVSVGIESILPTYLWGFHFNGIMHRSFISALLLIGIALPAVCYSVYYLRGGTPRAYDISRYPALVLPIVLVLAAYVLLIYQVIAKGAPPLEWKIIIEPYAFHQWREMVWKDGWPIWVPHSVEQAGIRNHILGTFLLIGLTSAISLPIGIGVGMYTNEYSGNWFAQTLKFSTQVLRALSVFIIAITAYNLVRNSSGSFLSDIICGYYFDPLGSKHIANGSFLTASIFLSLLVIPIIAKSTEEGIRSLPNDIKEGSLAVGASQDYSFVHLLLPWSMPNIITGLVLGCAEAAGSLSIILFMAGTGEYGVSPLNGVTSLAYLIFNIHYGKAFGSQVPQLVGSYQFTAALLLLVITMGLTIAALVLKRNISKRYKGA